MTDWRDNENGRQTPKQKQRREEGVALVPAVATD